MNLPFPYVSTRFFVFAPSHFALRNGQQRWLLYLAPGLTTAKGHDCYTRRFHSSQSCFYLICCFELFIVFGMPKKYTASFTSEIHKGAGSSKRNDNVMMMMMMMMTTMMMMTIMMLMLLMMVMMMIRR